MDKERTEIAIQIAEALKTTYPWCRIRTSTELTRTHRISGWRHEKLPAVLIYAAPTGTSTFHCAKVICRLDGISAMGNMCPEGGIWVSHHFEYDDRNMIDEIKAFMRKYVGEDGQLPDDHVHSGKY